MILATGAGGAMGSALVAELRGAGVPEALTCEQAAECFSARRGRPVRFVGLTDEQTRAAMSERGLSPFSHRRVDRRPPGRS